MPWAQLDDRLWQSRKVRAVSDRAFRLYICSISYAAAHLTDGYLDDVAVKDLRAVCNVSPRVMGELVDARLWDVSASGYVIHDYLHHNRSREEILELREKEREKKRQQRLRKRTPSPEGSPPGTDVGSPNGSPEGSPPSPSLSTPIHGKSKHLRGRAGKRAEKASDFHIPEQVKPKLKEMS